MNVAVLAAISAQTGLLAPCYRTLRSTEADLSHVDVRLAFIWARLVAFDAKRYRGGHVAVNHPRLIERRE